MTFDVRPAKFDDYPRLCAYDEFLGDRRVDMQKGEILVCDSPDEKAIGYLRISTDHFFDWPFVVVLSVKSEFRQLGAGSSLIRHASSIESLPRLYVSTEANNKPMRKLLAGVGASDIGYIDSLNLGEVRELIFRLK